MARATCNINHDGKVYVDGDKLPAMPEPALEALLATGAARHETEEEEALTKKNSPRPLLSTAAKKRAAKKIAKTATHLLGAGKKERK